MRRRERGLTLIEILLALIVMVLGVVGILALFPPALQSSTESMEETNAAIVGESVAQALTNAMRFAWYDATVKEWHVTLSHDLKAGGLSVKYKFVLPRLPAPADPTQGWKHYPGSPNPSPASPDTGGAIQPDIEQDPRIFMLAGDNWTRATVENVHNVNDPTDPYKQFAFCFDVRKVNTLEYLLQQRNPATNANYSLDELEPLTKLFEFRIHIFRTAQQAGSFGSGGTTTTTPGADFKRIVATVTKRISSK
jgi:type II secretory pathway pseudopilin PulG